MQLIACTSVFMFFFTALVVSQGENTKVSDVDILEPDNYDKYAGQQVRHFSGYENHCSAACPSCPDKNPNLFNAQGVIIGVDGSSIIPASCPEARYFISNCGKTWLDAYKICCTLGMSLVSLTTEKDYTCLNEAVAVINGSWWSSGTDVGCPVKHRKNFSWCSKTPRRFYGEEGWRKKEPDMEADDNCVRAGKQGAVNYLADEPCSNMYNFACKGLLADEVCVPECPACPDKDLTLFNAIGRVRNKDSYGDWFRTYNNDREYLVSMSDTLKWQAAIELCCKLGMKLLSFANVEERDFFYDRMLQYNYPDGIWTSATDQNCAVGGKMTFKWCGTDTIMPASSMSWFATGEPNNDQNDEKCVTTYNFINSASQSVKIIKDETCENSLAYACEGDANTNCENTCPFYPCPDRNPQLFDGAGFINENGDHYKITTCGKEFFVSKYEMSVSDAHYKCCQYGMKLLSIVSLDLYSCLNAVAGTKNSYKRWGCHIAPPLALQLPVKQHLAPFVNINSKSIYIDMAPPKKNILKTSEDVIAVIDLIDDSQDEDSHVDDLQSQVEESQSFFTSEEVNVADSVRELHDGSKGIKKVSVPVPDKKEYLGSDADLFESDNEAESQALVIADTESENDLETSQVIPVFIRNEDDEEETRFIILKEPQETTASTKEASTSTEEAVEEDEEETRFIILKEPQETTASTKEASTSTVEAVQEDEIVSVKGTATKRRLQVSEIAKRTRTDDRIMKKCACSPIYWEYKLNARSAHEFDSQVKQQEFEEEKALKSKAMDETLSAEFKIGLTMVIKVVLYTSKPPSERRCVALVIKDGEHEIVLYARDFLKYDFQYISDNFADLHVDNDFFGEKEPKSHRLISNRSISGPFEVTAEFVKQNGHYFVLLSNDYLGYVADAIYISANTWLELRNVLPAIDMIVDHYNDLCMQDKYHKELSILKIPKCHGVV